MARRLLIPILVALLATAPAAQARKRQPLQLGSHGVAVRKLQWRLANVGYLPWGAVHGTYTLRTWHAVVAFQGWSHLDRDGVAGPETLRALRHARRPRPWSRRRGIEVHLDEQVMLIVSHGRVKRAIHVSTGAGGATPLGHFQLVTRQRLSWSIKFKAWLPLAQYFYGGYALHEFGSVPGFPASHGCVRLPADDARLVWRFGRRAMRMWTARR